MPQFGEKTLILQQKYARLMIVEKTSMKYSKLIISGLPKTFNVTHAADYVQPMGDDARLEDVLYDFYFLDVDEAKGEDGVVLFKYNESATGVDLIHTPYLQTLAVELFPCASEADVELYAAFVRAVLAKHKRARQYDKYAPLKGLTDDDVLRMIKDREAYLKRLLTTKEVFTMEGINVDYEVKVAHLWPDMPPEVWVQKLRRQFVAMQWENEE
ncbi:MAG: hypothetical protein IJV19_03915 [Prevotella sp.]|nr:hypothetical protein [Prevotella sp.]